MIVLRSILTLVLLTSPYSLPAMWDEDEITQIKTDPASVKTFFKTNRKILKAMLAPVIPAISREELFLVYCQGVAHHSAPYGPSTDNELRDMLQAPTLNCGNYGLLGIRLAENAWPEALQKVRAHLTGWTGGAIGNHQLLFLLRKHREFLIDPTVGVVAAVTFDEFASGKCLELQHILHFGKPNANPWLLNRLYEALTQGLCRPRDLMYYYSSADRYLYPTPSNRWPCPAIQRRL